MLCAEVRRCLGIPDIAQRCMSAKDLREAIAQIADRSAPSMRDRDTPEVLHLVRTIVRRDTSVVVVKPPYQDR
jgi:hypothetical protein